MKNALLLICAVVLALLVSSSECRCAPRPIIGAIRWDAWVGPYDTSRVGAKDVGLMVEKALGPHQFHDRIPFFGKETGPDSVEVRELTQDVMDKEIQYAHDGGIDYWAFDWYPDGTGLDIARQLYMTSPLKKLVKYCWLMQNNYPRKNFPTLVNTYFKDPCYLKVLNNRPVLYLYADIYTPEDFDALRDLTRAAGFGDPYVVKCEMGKGGGHTVTAAFDGDMYSYWQAAPGAYAGEWIEVDLGVSTTFDKAVLVEPAAHTSAYEIRYWDGSSWKVAFTGTTIGTAKSPTIVTFPPVAGTKARLVFLSGRKELAINEFQLYDTKSTTSNLVLGRSYAASSTGYHYDALSHYVTGGPRGVMGSPFSAVMTNSEERWNRDKTFGLNVVPNLSIGADPSPRIVTPPSRGGYTASSHEPTPEEVGAHVTQVLHWIDANPGVDPARLVLIYAWNEFDEGGWICPTLFHGPDRLEAIRKALDAYEKK